MMHHLGILMFEEGFTMRYVKPEVEALTVSLADIIRTSGSLELEEAQVVAGSVEWNKNWFEN